MEKIKKRFNKAEGENSCLKSSRNASGCLQLFIRTSSGRFFTARGKGGGAIATRRLCHAAPIQIQIESESRNRLFRPSAAACAPSTRRELGGRTTRRGRATCATADCSRRRFARRRRAAATWRREFGAKPAGKNKHFTGQNFACSSSFRPLNRCARRLCPCNRRPTRTTRIEHRLAFDRR